MGREAGSRKAQYERARQHAEQVLKPFYDAKKSDWKARPVAKLLSDLFTMAENERWFAGESPVANRQRPANEPTQFWNREAVGQCILLYVASLSEDTWSKPTGWNLGLFQKLNIGAWKRPEMEAIKLPASLIGPMNSLMLRTRKGPTSFVDHLSKVDLSNRSPNRQIWEELAKHVEYLQTESAMRAFEHEPYSTAIFCFNKTLFRDQIWRSSRYEIDHSALCKLVLAPLYYSAIYEVKTLVQSRVKRKKVLGEWIDGTKLPMTTLVETYEPLDRCGQCGSPLLTTRKRRDSKFCDEGCKNDYHRSQKTKATNPLISQA